MPPVNISLSPAFPVTNRQRMNCFLFLKAGGRVPQDKAWQGVIQRARFWKLGTFHFYVEMVALSIRSLKQCGLSKHLSTPLGIKDLFEGIWACISVRKLKSEQILRQINEWREPPPNTHTHTRCVNRAWFCDTEHCQRDPKWSYVTISISQQDVLNSSKSAWWRQSGRRMCRWGKHHLTSQVSKIGAWCEIVACDCADSTVFTSSVVIIAPQTGWFKGQSEQLKEIVCTSPWLLVSCGVLFQSWK